MTEYSSEPLGSFKYGEDCVDMTGYSSKPSGSFKYGEDCVEYYDCGHTYVLAEHGPGVNRFLKQKMDAQDSRHRTNAQDEVCIECNKYTVAKIRGQGIVQLIRQKFDSQYLDMAFVAMMGILFCVIVTENNGFNSTGKKSRK